MEEFKSDMVTFDVMGSFPSQVLAGTMQIGNKFYVIGGFSSEEVIEKCRLYYYDIMYKNMIEEEKTKTHILCTTTKQ